MHAHRFLLGTHMPSWLPRADVSLFVSDTRLRDRKTLPPARKPCALDSGGFTQLQKHGRWTFTPAQYVDRCRRYRDEIGNLRWIAPMDHMCEPIIRHGGRIGRQVFAGTHRSVLAHQLDTVANFGELRALAPDLPIIPVIQGFTQAEYEQCVVLYERAGFDLATEPLVGLGSICRRQATKEVHRIILAIRAHGIRALHGFGVKTLGLHRYGHLLTSADSLAWSDVARKLKVPVCGTVHPRDAKNCANCLPFALSWRADLLNGIAAAPPDPQGALWNDDLSDAA